MQAGNFQFNFYIIAHQKKNWYRYFKPYNKKWFVKRMARSIFLCMQQHHIIVSDMGNGHAHTQYPFCLSVVSCPCPKIKGQLPVSLCLQTSQEHRALCPCPRAFIALAHPFAKESNARLCQDMPVSNTST